MSDSVVSPNSAASKPPGHDIFCTPENDDFLSKVPYQSLSKTDHEIRLLKILPDSGSGFVECELLPAVSLATVHNQYLALSYCAGSAKNTKPIKVNGVNSNVFANLHHALTCARHYWEAHAELSELLLWVDQICINQFDLVERSHQVGFMRDIYHNAKRTLICLSTKETDGEGLRWLAELKNMNWRETTSSLAHSIAEKSDTEEFAKGLAGFFEIAVSPWWGRAWVFQEFVVSTHATFLYGRYAMTKGDFSGPAIKCCWAIGLIINNRYPKSMLRQQLEKSPCSSERALWCYDNIMNILVAGQSRLNPNDLGSILLYIRDCHASDQRDRIYSVLGLASSGYGIVPDYSPENDIPQLLVETTKRIITFEDSLSILSHLNCYRGSLKAKEYLPSWVIDWIYAILPSATNQDQKPKMSYFTDYKITAGAIDASFTEAPHPRNTRIRTTALEVWGILLDTDFQKVENPLKGPLTSYKGSQEYVIESSIPIGSDQELWILCGAREPFLLSRYSFGLEIAFPVTHLNAVVQDGVMKFPKLMDDQGMYDTSKMDWKRLTIF